MADEKKILLTGILLGIGTIAILGFVLPDGDSSSIPPTPAWSNIASNDTDSMTNPAWANSTRYDDTLWVITDGSIGVEIIDYDTIKLFLNPAQNSTLGGVYAGTCDYMNNYTMVGIFQNGTIHCAKLPWWD